MLPLATERLRNLRDCLVKNDEQSSEIFWLLEICDSFRQITLALQVQSLEVATPEVTVMETEDGVRMSRKLYESV